MTIRLYDLCGAGDLRFSPYCGRAKMALAIKGLPYETVPVRFTEIGSVGDGSYKTLPVIEDDGTFVSDSFAIAEYLEERSPEHPLFSPGEAGRAAARFVEGTLNLTVHSRAMAVIVKDIHDAVDPMDKDYFRTSREGRLGKPLEAVDAGRAEALPLLRAALSPLRHVLRDRPFLGGDAPMFVDCLAYGSLAWIQAFGTVDLSDDEILSGWYGRCRAIVQG